MKHEAPEVIEAAALAYAKAQSGNDVKFIKHAATWLNQKCWTDEHEGVAIADDATRPLWALKAGFGTRFEAENAGCFERNAQKFAGGVRIEVTA